MSVGLALATCLGAGAATHPLRAQESPAIQAAIRLAASGQGDSARRIVARVLAQATPGDPAYVEALYWRGRLASSGDSAESDLRRVAIQYSNSRWADQALLQLTELAMAAGNGAGALQLAERLRNDYPTSSLRPRAALWAGRAAFDLGDPATACALLDSARAEAAGQIEFLNQLAFYRTRCAAVAAPPRADTSTGVRNQATAGGPYEVQIAATRSSQTAQDLLARVTRAGLHGRVVAGSDSLYRVRVGPYPTEHAADDAVVRLRRLFGGQPFVVSPS